MSDDLHFDTLQVHAGQVADPTTKSRAVPIYQTTSYVFDSAAHGAALFGLQSAGHVYTRLSNPTTDVFEKRMAALEGGVAALATASGMAAITYALLTLAQAGDEIVALSTLYGGTWTLLRHRLPTQFGIRVHLIDPNEDEMDENDEIETENENNNDEKNNEKNGKHKEKNGKKNKVIAAMAAAINDKTRAIFFESLGNPGLYVPDIRAMVALAHRNGLPVVCDNTFGTPYLFRGRDFGLDVVVHSATKYIGGHGTSLGGVVVDNGQFCFKGNRRFPQFNEPDEAYHGLVYADLGPTAFLTRARVCLLRDTGAALSPFNSFLMLLGLETLSLRVRRHVENAMAVATHLSTHPRVSWVAYPSLPGNRFYARAQEYMPRGAGAILTFGLKGGRQASTTFIDHLKIFSLLANVADAKSLAIHPASTTHAQLDEEGLKAAGVLPEMVRLSVGLEDIRDLIADIDQALEKVAA